MTVAYIFRHRLQRKRASGTSQAGPPPHPTIVVSYPKTNRSLSPESLLTPTADHLIYRPNPQSFRPKYLMDQDKAWIHEPRDYLDLLLLSAGSSNLQVRPRRHLRTSACMTRQNQSAKGFSRGSAILRNRTLGMLHHRPPHLIMVFISLEENVAKVARGLNWERLKGLYRQRAKLLRNELYWNRCLITGA